MAAQSLKNILVVGHPRSGTTWISEVLGAGRSVVSEPDNEVSHPLGFGFKRSHRFPQPEHFSSSGLEDIFRRAAFGDVGDVRRRALQRALLPFRWHLESWVAANCGSPQATTQKALRRPSMSPLRFPGRGFSRLCRSSMPASRPENDGRIIKSVHGVLVAEQIQQSIDCDVVVVVRNPFAVLSSLRRPMLMAGTDTPVQNPDRFRAVPGLPEVGEDRDMHQVVHLMSRLLDQADRQPQWSVVSHDQLCRDPRSGFQQVATELGIEPDPVLEAVTSSVGEGAGLSVQRTSTIDQIDNWKKSLDAETTESLRDLLRTTGLGQRLEALGATGER